MRCGGGGSVATTVSAADGAYGFDAVRPGSYTVEVVIPADHALSDPTGSDSQANPYAITVTDSDILSADFGFVPLEPSIALDKALIGALVSAVSDTQGHYDATFVFTLLNTGDVDLDGLTDEPYTLGRVPNGTRTRSGGRKLKNWLRRGSA